jgi:hypothetical protein
MFQWSLSWWDNKYHTHMVAATNHSPWSWCWLQAAERHTEHCDVDRKCTHLTAARSCNCSLDIRWPRYANPVHQPHITIHTLQSTEPEEAEVEVAAEFDRDW